LGCSFISEIILPSHLWSSYISSSFRFVFFLDSLLSSSLFIHTPKKKVLHHLGSTSSGTFTYKWNRDPHKQHFSSFHCSLKPHIAWCTIIQIDFQKLWSRLQYTPVPLIPSSTSSCIDACLYPSWHTIHKFIKA
jgi:hypothetical protein